MLRLLRSLLAAPLFAVLALCACGASGESTTGGARSPDPDDPSSASGGTTGKVALRGGIESATVFDSAGESRTCSRPFQGCPSVEPDHQFQQKCRGGGFQVRQCGCEILCSGNVAGLAKPFYDASGRATTCEPTKSDCSPAPAGAAFQDACAEKGYRLQVCGCEWLCSGNVTR